MRRLMFFLAVLSLFTIGFSNQLTSVIPSMDIESVTITLVFSEPIVDSYSIQSNPSRTVYSLSLNSVYGKDMNLPLRMGPVEGLWTRQEPNRFSINVALLIPARREPEVLIRNNIVLLRFFRSVVEVDVDKFTTYGMTIGTAMTYLFSEEILNLSYVLSPTVRNEQITVGFTLALPEEILRNILTSLGDKVAYAYLSDGTFYLGSPEEVRELVNSFWRIYIGVDFNVEGETVPEQIERLRKSLPVNSFIEYLPNEAALMVFGDLQTHFTLSSLLTSNTITKEFLVSSEVTATEEKPLVAYEELARDLNEILFSNMVNISVIPQLNKIILSGNSKYVEELYEYLEMYRRNLTSDSLDSSRTRITVTLPDNFFLMEDLLKVSSLSGSGLVGDNTLAGSILSIVQSYALYETVSLDRTFEPIGKVTFDLPNYLVPVLNKIMATIGEMSRLVSYSVINYHLSIDTVTLSQVERITGVRIEEIGERKGYIIKGSKAAIETASHLLGLFTGITFENYANTYIELQVENTFSQVKSFLDSFYASRGLADGEYSVEQISDRLVNIYAPGELLVQSLSELEKHENQIFRKTEEMILEISPEVYSSGLGELLNTIVNQNESSTFIESAGLLVLRGYPERLVELEKTIKSRIPRILEMIEKRIAGQERRMSLQIASIPGWDLDKLQTYLRDFLGGDLFSTITVTRFGNGYIIIGEESLLKVVESEAQKLRELENPFFRLEQEIPSVGQFELLLQRLGVAVTIIPVDSQFMLVGSRENVEMASDLVKQLKRGLSVEGDIGTTDSPYDYAFVNISLDEVQGLEELLKKLGLPVEFVSTPTGVAVVANQVRLEEAMKVINAVLSRLEPVQAGPKSYSIIDIDAESLPGLIAILEKLRVDVEFVETPAGVVGVGTDTQLEKAKKLVDEILKKEPDVTPQGDRERAYMIFRAKPGVDIESLKSVVNVFNYDLIFTPVFDKIVVVGDRFDLNSFDSLYGEILSSESVEEARVRRELKTIPGWDAARLASYFAIVFGEEKAGTISLVQTSKGYIVNMPESLVGPVESEFERLEKIEDPTYSIETKMPAIAEIESLLLRLGIIVDILPVENYSVIIGTSANVSKAREIIGRLVDTLGVPVESEPQLFRLSKMTSQDAPYFLPIFESIGIDVKLFESPAGIVFIGREDQLDRAEEISNAILDRKPSPQDSPVAFEFIPIATAQMESYRVILERLGLDVELLSSPSGVLLLGSIVEIDKARDVVNTILEQEAKAIVQEEAIRVSGVVSSIPGWTDEKYTQYFREYLGEDDFTRLSIVPSVVGYIVIGPQEILLKMESEAKRLAGIEDPYYVVLSVMPAPDQLSPLLERLGLKVSILPVGTKYLVVGKKDSVDRASEVIDLLNEGLQPPTEEIQRFEFIESDVEYIDTFRQFFEELKVGVKLKAVGSYLVAIGSESDLETAKEIIEAVSLRIRKEYAEESPSYLFVKIETSQIDIYREILEKLSLEVDLLPSPSGVLLVGKAESVKSAAETINSILSKEEELRVVPEESKRVSAVIGPIPGWDEAKIVSYFSDYLGQDEFSRVSLTPSMGGYIVIGPEEIVSLLENEALRLAELEDPYFSVEKRIPSLAQFEVLLETLGIKIKIIPLEDGYLVTGKKDNVDRATDLLDKIIQSLYPDGQTEQAIIAEPDFAFLSIQPEDIASLVSVVEKLGIEVELLAVSSGVVAIGRPEELERASGVIESILKHQADLSSSAKLDYRFMEIKPEQVAQYAGVIQRLGIAVDLLETPTGVLAVGTPEEITRAGELVEAINTREVEETPQKEKYESYLLLANVPGLTIESLKPVLEAFEYRITLLSVSDKLIAIGKDEDLRKFKTLYKNLQAREVERENRVPLEIRSIPGWELSRVNAYLELFLGADDFSRISVVETSTGYVVLTPLLLKRSIENEIERLRNLENPDFTVVERVPPVTDLTGLLARLGIFVQAIPMGERTILLGSQTDVTKAKAIIEQLVGSIVIEDKPQRLIYAVLEIATEEAGSFQTILQSLEIEVELLTSPSGVVAVGIEESVEQALKVTQDILSKRVVVQEEEPTYAFSDIPTVDLQSYQRILDRLGLDVELLPSPSGVLVVGSKEKLEEALKIINSVLSKEAELSVTEEEPKRVSAVIGGIPGWTDEKYTGYFRDYLGEDDFMRLSITPSAAGYIVIGPQEVLTRLEGEVNRLASIEDPFYVIEDTLPAIEQLGTLLDRLGLKVSILPIGDRYLIVGRKDSVTRTAELIQVLKRGVESPVTSENYEYMILEASSQIVETIKQVLSELKIEVSVISYGSNVILVGYKEALEAASEIVRTIRDKTGEVAVDEKLEYVFTDIPQDKIAEFSSILNSLKLEVQLLSSPSGVLLIGKEAEVERAVEVIKSVLSKSQEDISVESRYFNNPAGWEEGKLATYLRSYLGERDWVKIGVTPVQTGYLIVGPPAVLDRIQSELSRLASLEKPYYQIVDAVPSIQNLESLLKKMGLAVSVVTTDGKTMIIGTQSDVSQAVRVLGELARGIKAPDPEEKVVYAFIDIPSEEIENFRTIFDRLGISVDLINTPSGPIAFGAVEFVEQAKETATSILSRKESQVVAGETSYMIVEVRDGFDLASAQSVISAFNLKAYPLSVAGKLVVIGAGSELERFSKIRNDIISEHRVTVIVPREVSLEELSGISRTLQLDVSVFEIRNNFVVYGKEQDITKLRSILNELSSKEPSAEALQIETFTGIEVDPNYLREILDSMQISIKLYGEGTSLVAVGKASDLTSLRGLLKQLQIDSPDVTRSVAFYPKIEGWTGEILGNFFQAMDIDVLVFQENSRGYLLIGLPGDLERIKALLDGLEIKIKTVTKLYQIPSGMSFEELRDILLASGFNLSFSKIGQSMSISGPEDDVSMAIAMLDEVIRTGLGKGLSYLLIDLPVDLTLDKLQKIMQDMELTISIVQIEKRFMIIGTGSDLRRAVDIIEYLRPERPAEEAEKVYAVVALPEGLTVEEVSLLVEKLGINVEVLSVAENIVLIGTKNSIDAFKSLISTISGALGTGSRDTVSYKIASLPSGVTIPQFETLLSSLRISSRIVEISDSIVFVGTPEENAIAEELLREFKPQEVTAEDTSRSYTTISMPPGFDFASVSSILEKIGLNVDLTLAGNVLVVVGDKDVLPEVVDVISGLHGTGSRPEIMKLEYDVVELPLSMDMNTLNEAISALKIPSTLIKSGNSLLIIGSNADIVETKRLVAILQPRDLSEDGGRSYRIITMPEGFAFADLQILLNRTGADVEVLQVENILLLAGPEEAIESSIMFIEKLRKVSSGDTGDRDYEILSTTQSVGAQLLTQLFKLVGLEVEVLEGDGFVVFAGRKSEIALATEIFDSLIKKSSKDEGPLSYTITILPQSLTVGQLQEAFESIKIPVSLMEAGDYTIMVGTKDSLRMGQELIAALRIGVNASGTSADGSISYVTFGKPEGTEVNQLETIAGLMELKLKFQPVGDKIFMIGNDRDIASFEEVLKGLVVDKAGVINQFRYTRVIPGLDGETLNLYLVAKGVELAGIFDVSGGYLLVGNAEAIEQAQSAIDYLSDNQRAQFSYVDLPANLAMETLQRMASDLLLSVSFIQITPTRYMLIGATEDVNNLKTVLLEVAGDGTKLADYRIVSTEGLIGVDFDLAALETVFESIGLTVKTVSFGSRLILVGDLRDLEISMALISELGSSVGETKDERLTIAELTRVGGWSTNEIEDYLSAAEIALKAIVEYAGRLIGIGTQSNLEEANRALKFLNDTSVQESVRIDKSLVSFEQLSDMIRKLNLKIEFVELDRQWLLIGDSRSLMIITKTVEEAAADKEISRYVTDLTVDVQELAALLRESIDGVSVQTFENLQLLLLKSKSSALLDMAEAMIKEIQDSRKAVDPLEKGVTVKGPLVGINVVEQNLQRLLSVVAEKLEIPILFIDSLEDKITMSVNEISWEELVGVVNATKPVSIRKVGDLYTVTKKEQKSGQEATDIELVYRVYHNVAEVTRLIEFYGGQVLSDPVNGYIVVRGLAKSKVDSIFDEIASSLAKPKKQVKIETKLVDKSLLDEIERSVNTKINTTNPTIILQNGSLSLDFKVFENLDISKVLQGIIDSASAEIKANLKDKNADSDVISSPSIVSMSGEEATIHIGDTIPYLVKKIEFVEGRPVEVETIEFLNTGVELKITPTVNDDGKILLDLYIKVSEPEKYVDGTRTLYGEKMREATSKLVISDGNTLTIGGLVANKDSVNVNKMPFLSDLPFVGKLFTTQSVTTDRRELVIFITAEVVEP